MGEHLYYQPDQPQTGREAADLLRTTLRQNALGQSDTPTGARFMVHGGSFYFDGREESIVAGSDRSHRVSDVIYVEGVYTSDEGQHSNALLAFPAGELQFSEAHQLYLIPPRS